MDFIKTFLVNNYLWFLIISLILIFALIGYLADTKKKEQMGEDEEIEDVKPKKEKKIKKTDEEIFLEENEAALENISLNEAVTEKKPNVNEENVEIADDNVVTYDDSAISDDTIQEEEK